MLLDGVFGCLLIAGSISPLSRRDAKQFVQRAFGLNFADRDDHTRWIFFETSQTRREVRRSPRRATALCVAWSR
jgi:hypothetical protein